jgi:hypothetical protein
MKQAECTIDKIEADWITIEVIDKTTGKLFQRKLPVKYLETDNGIVLCGETLEGKPSQIHFLSTAALTKINELLGNGPNSPRCSEHTKKDGIQ